VSKRKFEMARMTNLQVEDYLKAGGNTVLIPIGSTEQHSHYGPLRTDRMIAEEVCRRAAPQLNALMAPGLSYGLSESHIGVPGVIYVKAETYMAFVKDIVLSLAQAGFRHIVFLNGHYENSGAVTYALKSVYSQLPPGTLAYCFSYWEALSPQDGAAYLGPEAGLHANLGETAIMLAVDPESVDMEHAVPGWPEPPTDLETNALAAMLPVILALPGTMVQVTRTGGWGDPTQATPAKGEEFLGTIIPAVVKYIRDCEKVYKKMFA